MFFTGCVFFISYLVIMFLEARRLLAGFDLTTVFDLQSIVPRSLDTPLSFFSLLGSFEVTSVLVAGIGLWVLRKKIRIFYPLLLFGMILVFEYVGKLFLVHPPPPRNLLRYDLPFAMPSSSVETSGSFPSGHVGRTIFLVIIATFFSNRLLNNKWLAKGLTVLYILAGIMMIISRVYLGEHWASDTIGGFLLGSAMGFFAVSYF